MAMQHRGTRQQMSVRLPFDEYREVAIRARARGWSMSDYVGWCVAKELGTRSAMNKDPLGRMPHANGRITGPKSPYVALASFDEPLIDDG